jgi:hypothetical protein
MKLKETYTLEDLCTGLTMPLVKFCQMAGITEATLIRLRKGYAGRQHTINSILATFSKVYGIDFSLENVEGLTVQDKPHQKGKKPSVSTMPIDITSQQEVAQISIVEPKKRAYTRKKDTGLPEGSILAIDFARTHGVAPTTFYDHMLLGLGPGTVPGEQTHPTLPVKEQVDYSERDKPGRKGERERYLTPAQQKATLAFWRRHGVPFTMPETEQEASADERPWYEPGQE